ncbi:MAG: T9SS type A sorting domain-containing protein [Bacteroidetes bacterium]|nr:T9SS type A sorting domain-containing protein [Bacteroidota bacterium]
MKKNIYFSMLLPFFVSFIYAQNEAWTERFNYSATSIVSDIATDSDGNLLVCGEFSPICYGAACGPEPYGYFWRSYDKFGNLRWSDTSRGNTDIYKGDLNTLTLWGAAADEQGNFFLGGRYKGNCHLGTTILPPSVSSSDGVLAKINNAGNWQWIRTFNFEFTITEIEFFNHKLFTTGKYTLNNSDTLDGHFLPAGVHDFVACFDTVGNCEWINAFGMDRVFSLKTRDSLIYALVYPSICKFSMNGSYTSTPGGYDDFEIGKDKSMYITGNYGWGSNQVYVAKKDSTGVTEWIVNLTGGGITIQIDTLDAVYVRTYEGTIFDSVSAVKINKYDSNGNHMWEYTISPTADIDIKTDYEGNIYLFGYERDFTGAWPDPDNARITKICAGTCAVASSVEEIAENNSALVFPNPTPGIFQLIFSSSFKGNAIINVIDSKGIKVYNSTVSSFSENFQKEIDLSKNSKGIYLIEIITDDKRIVKRIIVN